MGACTFTANARGATAREAFNAAVKQAQYDHGHGGYTGTIAEKHAFTTIPLPADCTTDQDARAFAEGLVEAGDPRVDDKWGPAGHVQLPESGEHHFFGWASE